MLAWPRTGWRETETKTGRHRDSSATFGSHQKSGNIEAEGCNGPNSLSRCDKSGGLRPSSTSPPPCPQSPGAEAKDSRAQMDQVKLSQTGIQSKLPEQWSCKGFTVGQLSQAFVSCVDKKKKDIKHVVVVGLKSHICF